MLGKGNCPNARKDIYETRSRKENGLGRQMKRRLWQGNNKTELKKHKKGRKVVCKREGFNVGWCFDWEYRIELSSKRFDPCFQVRPFCHFQTEQGQIYQLREATGSKQKSDVGDIIRLDKLVSYFSIPFSRHQPPSAPFSYRRQNPSKVPLPPCQDVPSPAPPL